MIDRIRFQDNILFELKRMNDNLLVISEELSKIRTEVEQISYVSK